MVQRKRASGLLWPTVAAGIVAVLLLLHPQLQRSMRPYLGEVVRPVVARAPVSTRPLFLPRPLQVAPPQHREIEELAETVAAEVLHRNAAVSGSAKESLGPADFLVHSAPVTTRLHAPLLVEQDELAGLNTAELADAAGSAATAPFTGRAVSTQAGENNVPTVPTVPALQRQSVGDLANAWPPTPSLDHLLDETRAVPAAEAWCEAVARSLSRLHQCRTISDPAAGEILQHLQRLADVGLEDAEQQADREVQKQWLRAAHALQRRLAAWIPIWETTKRSPMQFTSAVLSVDTRPVQKLVGEAAAACESTGDAEGWRRFLLLDQLANPRLARDPAARQLVAQRFLSRLAWDGLRSQQADWLETAEIQDLASAVRPWAASPVDYTQLLHQIERQESESLDLASIDVATAAQTLRFAGGTQPRQVATAINAHYRNANLRLSVTDKLLARLLPAVPDQSAPVRETILGTTVRGTSHVTSNLQLRLLPDDERWSLELLTLGDVQAATQGRQGPVAMRNHSQGEFVAATPITISPESIQVGEATVQLNHASRLRGMRTDFDGIPLIGSLVRGIAMAQYRDSIPQVRRISGARMQRRISQQIEEQIEQEVEATSSRLSERLLGPFAAMRLAPTVVDLRTDEHRLTARYRLAGDWQLAAFTPRPRAPSNNVLSLQVHQSALNNTFERVLPSAEPRSLREIATEICSMFGASSDAIPADLPEDVQVQFAKTRPVTVEIDDDQLWLTFRIVRLNNDAGLDLRHFIVRALYQPRIDGMQASFVREGHLSVSGARMSFRSRLLIRAIFNKVLAESRPLPLISPQLAGHPAVAGLEVSQLELRDGWIGLAIGPPASDGALASQLAQRF